MAHVAPIYPSFARGEVSPLMLGRIDIEQYPTCLEKCRNAYIRPYGCVTRLTGTEYIASTKNNSKARLLKFVFSPTDSYIIECGAGYFRFYQNGAAVTSGGNVYEIANDFYEDQLESIQYVQIDDIIKLTCLPHNNDNSTAKPRELIRNGSADWTFRNVTFRETPYLDANVSNITMSASATTGTITLESSQYYFTSSMIGAFMWLGTKVKDSTTNKDVQGYVKITGYTNQKTVTAVVQSTLSGTTATKLWGEGAFSDRRGYPSVVALYDGRLWYGRTPTQPRNLYGSKPYAYETFTPAVDNEDDAGINIQLATNANGDGSDIKWLVGGSYLLCGTYGGEFIIRGTGDEAITPTDVSARQRTNWGGEPIQPIVAGTFVHFIQRNGNKLRQFQYDFYYDAYKAVDVSIFSEHLLASPIKAMALQKNPDSIIYLMREDGKVVMLTLEQDQSVQAWSLLEDMGANVESIQTIPSYDGNYDEVYMVMNRQILQTNLAYTSSNPNLTITDYYDGTKPEGEEIVILTYNSTNGVWTSPDENKLNTKLTVTCSNPNLTPTTSYSGTQLNVGTITENLKYIVTENYFKGNNIGPFDFMHPANTNKIVFGNNLFVAMQRGDTRVTTNGTNWISAQSHPTYSIDVGLVYDGSKFISYGYVDLNDSKILSYSTSLDGITWSNSQNVIGYYNIQDHPSWKDVTYGNGKYVLIGSNGLISTSLDGITFQDPQPKLDNSNWVSITYGNLGYWALNENGNVSTSTDCETWVAQGWIPGANFETITYVNTDNYFAAGNFSQAAFINNHWESTGYGDHILSAAFGNGIGIALGPAWYMTGSGEYESQTSGDLVNLDWANYKISISGMNFGDILTCVWTTINDYAPLSDYKLNVTGTPEQGDTITLTYTSTYSSSQRHIERMMNPITSDNRNDWWYVRSGLKYDGYALTKGSNLTLSANSGIVTATASSAVFISAMQGNRIRFIDDNYNILGEGEILSVQNTTTVTLKITTYFQSLTITGGKWGISTESLSGLDHLDGRKVQVFADGKEQESKIVASGSIDIDDAFIALVGLPYTSYITTMPMEAGSQNGTAVGKRKRISEMAIRVWNSLGIRVGRDLDNLYDTIYEQTEPYTGVIPNIKYNQGWVWDANITVEQSKPYPMNILAIAPIVTEVDK